MLVGRKVKNHPQQVQRRGALDTVDERLTPDKVFSPLHAKWKFTLDSAASDRNAKCADYFTLERSGLVHSWGSHRVWCNPPYSNIRPWVEKAIEEVQRDCPIVVMLLPANRTEQKWWQELVEPRRDQDWREDFILGTEFLPGRINFGVPGNEGASYKTSAPFGCVLLTFRKVGQ